MHRVWGKRVLEAVVLAVNATNEYVPQFKGFSLAKMGTLGNKTMYNFFYITQSLLEAKVGVGILITAEPTT